MKNEQALSTLVDNWINGNRAQARQQAKRHTHDTLIEFLTNYRDWSYENAAKVALWLKGGDRYQEACDATAAEIHSFNL